jgi:orotate phosphoribosyltransferase-like protein
MITAIKDTNGESVNISIFVDELVVKAVRGEPVRASLRIIL